VKVVCEAYATSPKFLKCQRASSEHGETRANRIVIALLWECVCAVGQQTRESGTPLFSHHSTEWGTDLVFKKPWDLSEKVEFMVGAGPEWVHTNEHARTPNSLSAEAVADFMFWRSARHRFGWYLEPTYEYNFGRGHEQSLGITAGLLITIR